MTQLIILLAILIEGFVEYAFGTLFSKIEALKPYSWMLMYVAMAGGVGLAFAYQVDLVNLVVPDLVEKTAIGYVLSGLVIGRGSEYVHKLLSKFLSKDAFLGSPE